MGVPAEMRSSVFYLFVTFLICVYLVGLNRIIPLVEVGAVN